MQLFASHKLIFKGSVCLWNSRSVRKMVCNSSAVNKTKIMGVFVAQF